MLVKIGSRLAPQTENRPRREEGICKLSQRLGVQALIGRGNGGSVATHSDGASAPYAIAV